MTVIGKNIVLDYKHKHYDLFDKEQKFVLKKK